MSKEGIINASFSIRAELDQFDGMSKEQIAAFMNGLAAILAACPEMAYEMTGNRMRDDKDLPPANVPLDCTLNDGRAFL